MLASREGTLDGHRLVHPSGIPNSAFARQPLLQERSAQLPVEPPTFACVRGRQLGEAAPHDIQPMKKSQSSQNALGQGLGLK